MEDKRGTIGICHTLFSDVVFRMSCDNLTRAPATWRLFEGIENTISSF
jgi:hypothetical protein